jgi:hypothetical protein
VIVAGRVFEFSMLVAFVTLTLVLISRARKYRKYRPIRSIPALDAVKEAVGRCTEMGRPIHWTAGDTARLASDSAPQVIAGLTILSYVAGLAAEYKVPLICTVGGEAGGGPDIIPLIEQTVRDAYTAKGVPADYKQENIRFISGERAVYGLTAAVEAVRNKVGANIMTGALAASVFMIAEQLHATGAITISGTGRSVMIAPLVCVSDYVLIGEELFAAGAKLSQEPDQLGSIFAQDLAKGFVIALILAGLVLTAVGSTAIQSLLNF